MPKSSPRRPPHPDARATDRRGWLAQAPAGAACATFATEAGASPPKHPELTDLLERAFRGRPRGLRWARLLGVAFLPLGALGRAGTERDPRTLLASVHANAALAARELPGRLINGKMKSAAELPEFRVKVDALAPSDSTLAALAAASVRLYLQSGDFTALHAVTGTHAYRLLEPFIQPPEIGLRYLWQALVAAYVSIGTPSLVEPPAGSVPAWNESLERARASGDEHDIELVDIAHQQGTFYGDPLYRRAAALRMGLVERG